ncbi:MAG: hypothetical protein K6U74_08190 [Firmicutes bacterium]|nr:hypothetical protein [Bacillota bacterium]
MLAETTDGRKIKITAHIKLSQPLAENKAQGAFGIGLLELWPIAGDLPVREQEERYFDTLRELGETAGGEAVTILLPDLGLEPTRDICHEKTPSPGCHGIRAFLAGSEFYRPYLRAVLRAGTEGSFEMALPMVGHVSEITGFKETLHQLKSELEEEGRPCSPPPTGIMVEVPSVIPSLDIMLWETRFFLVGKRFLKFLMADDRLSNDEDDFFPFYHRAFLLQALALTENLRKRKGYARICAPIVKDPPAVPLLVGLGFGEIVAPPELIPGIVEIIESISYLNARMTLSKAIAFWHPEETRAYAEEALHKLIRHHKG